MDSVSLLNPRLLVEVSGLIVESGHAVAGKKPGAPLRGRCDSFVVETDVHYPTDVSLLWDAVRCMVRETGRAATEHDVPGWRQCRHLLKSVKALFQKVRRTRRAGPERVEGCLERCRELVPRAEGSLPQLATNGVPASKVKQISDFISHAMRRTDQTDRRLLRGGTIPHGEKVFPVFEPHTRWISKGKAGYPVELGVPVCILEDRHGFVLHHDVMWEGGDVDRAAPMAGAAQARFPDLRAASFDRGLHSPENRIRLDAMLDCSALPKKGCLSKAERERESGEDFAAMRRQHPAVESATSNLEHRCLDRVRAHGAEGFERAVALSVLALNVHRIGLLLRREHRRKRRRAA